MNYLDLKSKAENNWNLLANGSKPWIRVGTALCGKAAGADAVIERVRGELSKNSIEAIINEVGCLGLCYAEPLVDILNPGGSRVFYRNVTPEMVPELIESHLKRNQPLNKYAIGYLGPTPIYGLIPITELATMKPQVRIALRNAGHIDPGDIQHYLANGGYLGLHKALTEMTPETVIEEITTSGLRGRGGAGFPTAIKWKFLIGSNEPVKYILCNCEEGDPGAFNDKGILDSDPHTLLEGIIIAGYATKASKGYIFIRHGHDGPIDRAQRAITEAYNNGLLGKNILESEFNFDVEVSLTGDSYVSGEETALMESIEGKRAMPRYRPPFPAQFGLWGKPSNINNVKTLSYVPEIIAKGGKWFSGFGVNKSTGTAILCLTGDVVYPGMYEIPMGLTIREVIYDIAGGIPGNKKLKILQTGGPLGGVLNTSKIDVPLDFEAMAEAGAILGSGGIIIGDEDICAVDLTRVLVAFCQFESCGKCFPCRLGTTHLLEILERICRGDGDDKDMTQMESIGKSLQAGSLCGHGQLGFNPVKSAFQYFAEDFKIHIKEKRCPTGKCSTIMVSPSRTRP